MKGILPSLYKPTFPAMLMGNCINEIKLNCWFFFGGGGGTYANIGLVDKINENNLLLYHTLSVNSFSNTDNI